MNQNLYEMIFKRKSFHLFRNLGEERITPEDLDDLREAYRSFTPLYPEIRTDIRILPAKESSCRSGQEYCVYLYSEKKENYLQNIGYLGQQLDLYLVSRNIGTLWFGIGKPDMPIWNGLEFCIMIAFSKVDDEKKFRKDVFKSKRKPIEETWIGDPIPGVTDIARFAPSACNSQPWRAEREGNTLKVYRYRKPGRIGILPINLIGYYNQIDMGIYLCILELCMGHESIAYEKTLYPDGGGNVEKTLLAVYTLKE